MTFVSHCTYVRVSRLYLMDVVWFSKPHNRHIRTVDVCDTKRV